MTKKATFVPDKMTKNTIRFAEKVATDLDTPVLGTIYVNKAALKDLGWTDTSNTLTVELSVGEG